MSCVLFCLFFHSNQGPLLQGLGARQLPQPPRGHGLDVSRRGVADDGDRPVLRPALPGLFVGLHDGLRVGPEESIR